MDVFESKLSELINKKRGTTSVSITKFIADTEADASTSTRLQGNKEVVHQNLSEESER